MEDATTQVYENIEKQSHPLDQLGLPDDKINLIDSFVKEFKANNTYGWGNAILENTARIVRESDLVLEIDPNTTSYDCWSASARMQNMLIDLNLGENFEVGMLRYRDQRPMTQHFRTYIRNKETNACIELDLVPFYPEYMIIPVPSEGIVCTEWINKKVDLSLNSKLDLFDGLILGADLNDKYPIFTNISWVGDRNKIDGSPILTFNTTRIKGKYTATTLTGKFVVLDRYNNTMNILHGKKCHEMDLGTGDVMMVDLIFGTAIKALSRSFIPVAEIMTKQIIVALKQEQ